MNRLWKQFVSGNLLLALLLLAACGGEQPDPEPLVVTAGKPGTPTLTPDPYAGPTRLPVEPTSTPVPDLPAPLPDPAEIQTLAGLQAWVVAAYQHGADPAEVLSQLTEACWVKGPADYMPQLAPAGAALQPVDLTGDGVAEWLVTVATDGSGPLPCGGSESFFSTPAPYILRRIRVYYEPCSQPARGSWNDRRHAQSDRRTHQGQYAPGDGGVRPAGA